MIKISERQRIPRFYLPVKYSVSTRQIECYLFFIAPFAMIYEKITKVLYNIWSIWFWGNATDFINARKIMLQSFVDEDLYNSYKVNIAMCIYDSRRNDGRLNHSECNKVAEKLIKLIFD